MKEAYDLAIIGAGAAGCTAAIYSARRGLKTVLFDMKSIGGLFTEATVIENYPGFEKISGIELAMKFMNHVKTLPVTIIQGFVENIKKKNDLFEIKTEEDSFTAKSVMITSGLQPKGLGLENEKKFIGKGISYCATCDAPLFQGKDVAVVGGGNSAFYYALHLSEICNKVYLLNNKKEFVAEDFIVSKLKAKKNVEFKTPFCVSELKGNKFLESIKIKNHDNNKEEIIKVSGLFIAIGQAPRLDYLKDLKPALGEKGSIKIDQDFKTSIEGMFAAGDITGTAGQIVIAAGQGAKAAMNAAQYLKEK
jgi:thioredoxin reductase (NADPH)